MLRISPVLNNQLPFGLIRTAVQTAEEEGYPICWVTEGIGAEAPTLIAALAGSTSTIRLGTGILPVYTRTASLMVRLVLSMDQIMPGRFVLGLGAGHGPHLWKDDAIRLERPFHRLRDYVHVIRETLASGRLSYHGSVITVPDLHFPNSPMPDSPVPIYLAALGPRMGALAGEVADGVLFNAGTPDYLAEAIAGVRDAARRAGRDPSQVEMGAFITACTGPSGEEICRRSIALSYMSGTMPFYEKHLRACGFGEDMDKVIRALEDGGPEQAGRAVSDRLLDDLALFGDPAGWRDKLARLEKAGVTLVCPYIGLPDRQDFLIDGLRSMAVLGREPHPDVP